MRQHLRCVHSRNPRDSGITERTYNRPGNASCARILPDGEAELPAVFVAHAVVVQRLERDPRRPGALLAIHFLAELGVEEKDAGSPVRQAFQAHEAAVSVAQLVQELIRSVVPVLACDNISMLCLTSPEAAKCIMDTRAFL